ncbi:E3 ubiquitin-protein ligase XIAP [Mugil cephalus]|uniref:E3 ubiquitin-protein ligase XIAP n=1 Tax=Mugil cephalus TaxID=48193 RepID=UPI001FB68A8F|nr:E3 ubiquitin-protein ligase XIAP [Mugil cephalus]
MCDLSQGGVLESDDHKDFSLMSSRLDSFRGSRLALEVPAERLARAGFFFTGHDDCVRCFSCHRTVENWHRGDTPVERHKEVSPSCKFLSCAHHSSFNSNSDPSTNGSIFNEEAEDREYRLRIGEVVDETTYPVAPHMKSEEARLQTFTCWPTAAPVTPQSLAQAGLYHTGQGDIVQCFCCGGKLAGWEPGDVAWEEHTKFFPYCFFILGHDVGNIPIEGGMQEDANVSSRRPNVPMGSFEERLHSFAGVQHPVNHERLARAGFYSTGERDEVLCFHCNGGLKDWQPSEDPWEEHAKYYPGCSFLLAEKGQEFVNSIQLQRPQNIAAAPSHQNGFSQDRNEILQSAIAQKAIKMGLEPSVVENAILEKISRSGSSYPSLEALVQQCLDDIRDSDAAKAEKQDEDPMEKLQKLQREKLCKICMDRDNCIVFIPCGHLATCKACSESLIKCPICCGEIKQKVRAYIA